jgi:hypothetical protein
MHLSRRYGDRTMMLRRHNVDSSFASVEKNPTKKIQPKVLSQVERLDEYYDDSSDDDEISKKLSTYRITQSWKQKEASSNHKFNGRDFLKNDELLSFVAHCAGIKLLYSTEVNKLYYPIKNTLLRVDKTEEKPSAQLHNLIKTACIETARETHDSLERFLSLTQKSKMLCKKLIDEKQKILDEINKELNEIISINMDMFIQWIKQIKYCHKEPQPESIIIFEKEILTLFLSIFKKHYLIKDFNPAERNAIKKELLELANTIFCTISKELEFVKHFNLAGKTEAITLLSKYQTPYQNLLNELKIMLEESPARGYVQTMLSKQIEAKQQSFLQAYILDLIYMHQSSSRKKPFTADEKNIFDKYLIADDAAIHDEVITMFTVTLKNKLENNIKSFYRPTLGKTHVFASNNPYGFYANLRLSNRSQKRQALNLKNAVFKTDAVSRSWRLNSITKTQTDVVETQQITSAFSRKDIIENLGNYEKVYQSILQIKTYFSKKGTSITDAHIATWIRKIFMGFTPEFDISKIDAINIMQKLQSITYLLFGCEATRNPAMHVISQMLLDLIIANQVWNFEAVFIGDKKMPMVPEGAVAITRRLESEYRPFMPYAYFYYGVEENACKESHFHKHDLIQLEADVVRAWIKMKFDDPIKIAKSEWAEWLLEKIESHFTTWLGNAPKDSSNTISLKK